MYGPLWGGEQSNYMYLHLYEGDLKDHLFMKRQINPHREGIQKVNCVIQSKDKKKSLEAERASDMLVKTFIYMT